MVSPGWALPAPNPEGEQELRYDPAIVVDVAGAVTDVREAFRDNPLVGLHLLVQTRTGVLDIYLGPTDYLKEFELVFSKGAFVQIIGSAVSVSGGRVVLAREVRTGKTTLSADGLEPSAAPKRPWKGPPEHGEGQVQAVRWKARALLRSWSELPWRLVSHQALALRD